MASTMAAFQPRPSNELPPTPPRTPTKRKRTLSTSSIASTDSMPGVQAYTATQTKLSAVPRALLDDDDSEIYERATMSPQSEQHMERSMDDLRLNHTYECYDSDIEVPRTTKVRFQEPDEIVNRSKPSGYHALASTPTQDLDGAGSDSRSVKRCRRRSPSPPPSSYNIQHGEHSVPNDGCSRPSVTQSAGSGLTATSESDAEDDGRGLNGVGFRPTPAVAWARKQRRRQQILNWKAQEAKEARERRAKLRLVSRTGGVSKTDRRSTVLTTATTCRFSKFAKPRDGCKEVEKSQGARMVRFAF